MDVFIQSMENTIIALTGTEAWSQLSDRRFLEKWERLYQACPWATPFQSPGFVCTWFTNYHNLFSPVILSLEDGDRGLSGLLTLALSPQQQRLVVAGAYQAEYQVWLAEPDFEVKFIKQMMAYLDSTFPGYALKFKYLPEETPGTRALQSEVLHKRLELRAHPRPLMLLEKEIIEASFRKKGNKSILSRLRRLGSLDFKRITDETVFAPLFDEIITFYDLRQGAINNTFPFLKDASKKPFHLDLLKKSPDLLHVTITTLDNQLIAAHIGVASKDRINLGIIAHSPWFTDYSPGKLHLRLLARHLVEEGYRYLDLTPGGDPWKDRFATTQDQVYELIVHKSAKARAISVIQKEGKKQLKKSLERMGLSDERIQQFDRGVKRFRQRRAIPELSGMIWKKVELQVFRRALGPVDDLSSHVEIKRDHLQDLIQYQSNRPRQGNQNLLVDAMQRLEQGGHIYTLTQGERLSQYGWLNSQKGDYFLPEIHQALQLQEDDAALEIFFTDPKEMDKYLFSEFLKRILSDTEMVNGVKQIYLILPAEERRADLVIKKLGFEDQCRLFYYRLFGFAKKWSINAPYLNSM